MIFALIHEMGHLLTGILLGMKPDKLEIVPYGVSISFKLNLKDYNKKIGNGNILSIKKIIIALAGPLNNLIIIFITFQLNYEIFSELIIIYANILLIIFNMLPFYPLDGGRILKEILHIIFGKRPAEKYINNISFITIMILTFISSILIYSTKNIAIFIIIIILWCLYIKEDLIYRRKSKLYKLIEKT
jgi:stage IV sporulation protein FB